jgi:hypothetical protein
MTTDQLRKLLQVRPFQPFRIHLADGRNFDVSSPEFLAVSQGGRTLSLSVEGDCFEHIDLLLVTSLEELNGRRPGNRRRR